MAPWASQIELGAVEYKTVPLGEHESVTCVVSGLWLVEGGDDALVVMLRSADRGDGESLGLEVMARERERIVLADGVLERVERQAFGMARHAARPGRIDQAVELPLPDAAGRRRLVALYGEGLDLVLDDEDAIISELDGVSPAFIRELLRRAALVAAEEGPGPLRVLDRHVREALGELRQGQDALTRTLLGDAPDLDED